MAKKAAGEPLYEKVLKTIEGQIIAGVYRQGDLLPSEKELIESMGVSRITVRKALAILAEMGLIETSKGRGSVVLFNPQMVGDDKGLAAAAEEYRRLFLSTEQIRLLMEPEIARQAALCATPEQVEMLRRCMEEEDQGNTADFHRAIVSILGNRELEAIFHKLLELEEASALSGIVPPERQKTVGRILDGQHEKIWQAIADGSGEFAYFYMKEHMLYVMKSYEEYFKHLY